MSSYRGPINPNPAPGDSAIIIYGYTPSLVLAIVAIVLFAGAAAAHAWWAVKGRRLMQGLILGGCVSCAERARERGGPGWLPSETRMASY
jgi:xanthine/CO dehydrogenase XdhC/CoxF family maturation factor